MPAKGLRQRRPWEWWLSAVAALAFICFLLDTRSLLEYRLGLTEGAARDFLDITYEAPPTALTWIDEDTDAEWVPVLREGGIVSVKPIKGEVPGLAEKWLVTLEGNYKAMVKPVQSWTPIQKQWRAPEVNGRTPSAYRPKKADRQMQGYNEIAAYYVDRVLELRRKPPIVGRRLSSKLLFSYALHADDVVMTQTDKYAWLKHMVPEQEIPVSMHAWMDGLHQSAPSFPIQDFLLHSSKKGPLHPKDRERAAEVSDTLVFDFLLDDHDRGRDHNWIADASFKLLLWDSGLAFSHGPMARDWCLSLLCGPEKWVERFTIRDKKCEKICKFRFSTIDQLRRLSVSDKSLGQLVSEAMEEDELDPLDYNLYYIFGRWPKVQFQRQDFFDGLDRKVERLLAHVTDCLQVHGDDTFII